MEKKSSKKDEAIDLFRLCSEYCKIIEKAEKVSLHELLDQVSVSLMAVYQKVFMITRFQTKYENEPKHFLTERQYNKVRNGIKEVLGKKDEYQEIIDPNRPSVRVIFKASISEDLADIYQDFTDFCQWYAEGTFESINDSVIELLNNYDKYWGIKLLNVLKAIHVIRYMKKDASLFSDPLGEEVYESPAADDEEDSDEDDDDSEDMEELLNEEGN
ncbi:MAG TPA: DUF5063 domain-containing protein [Bacteroidales bacterium]|nr:DUF5063 domain-containing protein [Bacteroidales bacterium]